MKKGFSLFFIPAESTGEKVPCSHLTLEAQPGPSTATRLFYFRLKEKAAFSSDFSRRTVSLKKSQSHGASRGAAECAARLQSSPGRILFSCVICTCVFLAYYFLSKPIIKRLEATSTADILLCPSIPKLWLAIRWSKQGQSTHLFGSGKSMNGGNPQHPLPSTKPGQQKFSFRFWIFWESTSPSDQQVWEQ